MITAKITGTDSNGKTKSFYAVSDTLLNALQLGLKAKNKNMKSFKRLAKITKIEEVESDTEIDKDYLLK